MMTPPPSPSLSDPHDLPSHSITKRSPPTPPREIVGIWNAGTIRERQQRSSHLLGPVQYWTSPFTRPMNGLDVRWILSLARTLSLTIPSTKPAGQPMYSNSMSFIRCRSSIRHPTHSCNAFFDVRRILPHSTKAILAHAMLDEWWKQGHEVPGRPHCIRTIAPGDPPSLSVGESGISSWSSW